MLDKDPARLPTTHVAPRLRQRFAMVAALGGIAMAAASCGGGDPQETPTEQAQADDRAHAMAAPTWTRIAKEGQNFSVAGTRTVRYGSGSKWVEKSVTGNGKCSNSFFGKDPAVGVSKVCDVKGAAPPPPPPPPPPSGSGLSEPRKKDIAMQIVSSAENSSLDWKAQYKYIEDIGDGRGYTAGIIGFCSGTGDMLEVVQDYTDRSANNVLAKYLPALRRVNGSASHAGLDPNYPADWRKAATDPLFLQMQDKVRDTVYFNPAVDQAKKDGLRTLGQFIYYDAIVMHGPGEDKVSFGGIRKTALARAKPPSQGGNEVSYLNAFLDARVAAMKTEEAHSDTSRVDTAQRVFLKAGNLDLNTPLNWKVYGDSFSIK